MSSTSDDHAVGGQLYCGAGTPTIFGIGDTKVDGSVYIEGPQIVGDPSQFSGLDPNELGTVMAAQTTNSQMIPIPFYSLFVKTYARIKQFLKVDKLLTVELIKSKVIYTEVLMAKTKNFIIQHPLEEKMKLVHACLEGPENAVYIRGRVLNRTEIELPLYWKGLVDFTTITVSLTPIGAHQDVIVKRIDDRKVYLQSKGGMPIQCFYHIFAERIDVQKLEVETY